MSRWDRLSRLARGATRKAFGQAITFARTSTGPSAPALPIQAVFDPAAELVDPDAGRAIAANVRTTTPALWVDVEALGAEPAQGDTAVIDGEDWTVVDVEPDGAGGFLCILHKGGKLRW